MGSSSESGFYGKLPCRGDFMQRRVSQAFVDAWDAWLQQAMHASREQLGSQWLDLYLTSPVWRFVLDEGICGESAYAGVMLPSVDRVGRYFPLTLLTPLEVGSCLLEVACGAGRGWFEAAETLARRVLEASDLDLEIFDAEVEALASLMPVDELAQSNQLMERLAQSGFAGGASAWHISMLAETPQRAANALASIELERAFRPCALWWTQGSDAIEPGWLISSGLPTPARFLAMLSGRWREGGWMSVELAASSPQYRVEYEEMPAEPGDTFEVRRLEVDIDAVHPPLHHAPGETAEPRFVKRPEIGLWGVIVGDGVGAGARADLLSDVAHDLAPQATLTTQVELARRALETALRSRAAGSGGVAVLLLIVSGTECALLSLGPMRAVRVRDGAAMEAAATAEAAPAPMARAAIDPSTLDLGELVGGGAPTDENALLASAAPPAGDDRLLALLAAPPAASVPPSAGAMTAATALSAAVSTSAPAELTVRYERLESDDLWLLGTKAAISQALIDEILGSWPGDRHAREDPGSLEQGLESLLAQHLTGLGADAAPPLMLLAARLSESADT